jgi:hypothetical protein
VKSLSKSCLWLALLLLLAGCATSVKMEITRPAEVNMAGAKRVAVMDFGIPPEDDKARTYDELWALALAKLLHIQPSRQPTLVEKVAQYTTERMIDTLAKTNYFEVINPGDISQAIIASGRSNPNPIMIGQLVGAQAIIVGDITRLVKESEQVSKSEKVKDKKTGKETQTTVLYLKRELSLKLTYRAVNTTTGAIMATKTLGDSNTREIRYADRANLEPEEEVFRKMIDEMLPKIAKQIAPYKETVYRGLMKDERKDPQMEKADEFVKNSIYDSALRIYLDVWKASKNPAAGVNAGIMYEVLGDLDSALATVKEVVDATANKTAMGEYKRLLQEKKSQEELLQQL